MKEIIINISGQEVGQEVAQKIGQVIAEADNPESIVVSRYNRTANACSPCCLKGKLGDTPGWEVYGKNHGGRLKITINDGDYVFIFS
nr:AF1514 family protein [Desulfobulbaceae bacterium]